MTNIYIAVSQEDGGSLTIDGQLEVLTRFLESMSGCRIEPEKVAAIAAAPQKPTKQQAEKDAAHARA